MKLMLVFLLACTSAALWRVHVVSERQRTALNDCRNGPHFRLRQYHLVNP